MLDCRPTTPQDYRERSGFGRRREREWGHGGTAAGSIRSTHSCASISLAMTGSRCAARRLQQSTTARLPLHRMRSCARPRSAPSGCWHCGTLCPMSKSERKLATARLIDQLWSAIEALPDPEPQPDPKRPSKQDVVIAMLRLPEGATVDEVASVTGWQR